MSTVNQATVGRPQHYRRYWRRLIIVSALSLAITACSDKIWQTIEVFRPLPTPKTQAFILIQEDQLLQNKRVVLTYSDGAIQEGVTDVNGRVIFPLADKHHQQAANLKVVDESGLTVCHWNVVMGGEADKALNTVSTFIATNPTSEPPDESGSETAPEGGNSSDIPPPTPISFIETFDRADNLIWDFEQLANSANEIQSSVVDGELRYDIRFASTNRPISFLTIPYNEMPSSYTFGTDAALLTPPMSGEVIISLVFGKSKNGDAFHLVRYSPQAETFTLAYYQQGAPMKTLATGAIPTTYLHTEIGDMNHYEVEMKGDLAILRVNQTVITQHLLEIPINYGDFALGIDGPADRTAKVAFDNVSIEPNDS